MSSRLADALASGGFDAVVRRERLAALHLPFQELVSHPVEDNVLKSLRNGDRVGLVGPSGSGKSSVLSYLAHRGDTQTAFIIVPVTGMPEPQVSEPLHVARRIVEELDRLARESTAAAVPDSIQLQAGMPWLNATLAFDLSERASQHVGSLSEAREVLGSLLDEVGRTGAAPVLVFDDTDRWLDGFGFTDARGARDGFFSRALRWLADEIPASLAVCIHEQYLDGGWLPASVGPRVEIPPLSSAGHLRRLIDHRLEASGAELLANDIFAADALLALWARHQTEAARSLRATLRLAKQAVQEAANADLDQVTSHIVGAAAAG